MDRSVWLSGSLEWWAMTGALRSERADDVAVIGGGDVTISA